VLVVDQGKGMWGAQRVLLDAAPALTERGVDLVLAAPDDSALAIAWRAAEREHVGVPTVERRTVRSPNGRFSARLALREAGITLSRARRMARLAKAMGIDVIDANSHWSHLECVMAGRLARRPVVVHLHELSERDWIGGLRGAATLLADATIAVSGAVADSLPAGSRRRLTVVRNGIDPDRWRPGTAKPAIRAEMAADPAAPVVVAVSRIDPGKGVDDAIRAVAQLKGDLARTQLAVVGAPNLEPASGPRVHALGRDLLGERVRFLGERTEIGDLLRAADVLVQASRSEGLPLSVLEAQACGTAVVAYRQGGLPEIVSDGETGLLVPNGDITALSGALERLLCDELLHGRIERAARKRVETQNTLELQAEQHASILASVIGRSR
jgi:glycosyltransferase involved in cell wall biosynthesis